ncbi:LytTR family DNA-binding domain-containing protein [soil metagenome]
MRVLIVEDEQLAVERLSMLIRQYDKNILLADPLDTVKETVSFLKGHNDIDLLFLDIQLADGKSFEIFNKVDFEKPVIFTTAFDQYSLKAFKVNSIDYLLKPIKYDELKWALDKFNRLRSSNSVMPLDKEVIRELFRSTQSEYKKRFLVKQASKFQYKAVEDIAYLFAEGKIAYLVSKGNGKQFIIDHTMEELEDSLLDPLHFFRISRKHIIHIKTIDEVKVLGLNRLEIKLTIPSDQQLVVSRERVADFKRWLDR